MGSGKKLITTQHVLLLFFNTEDQISSYLVLSDDLSFSRILPIILVNSFNWKIFPIGKKLMFLVILYFYVRTNFFFMLESWREKFPHFLPNDRRLY